MTIRSYEHGDHDSIAEIFSRAIHEIAIEDYTREQCEAWASPKPNPEHWEARCGIKRPFVAKVDRRIAGFLELDPDGHIDCAYVNPDFKRRGVMTALVRHAVLVGSERAIGSLCVEASLCIKPLFEKLGFVTQCRREVEIRGQCLTNFEMILNLSSA